MSPDIITATGDLFQKVPGVASSKGVAMNVPPAAIFADVHKLVTDTMMALPEDERISLVAIATKTGDVTNTNLALAVKAGGHVDVVAWVGKSWGTPVAAAAFGGAIRIHG